MLFTQYTAIVTPIAQHDQNRCAEDLGADGGHDGEVKG
jgi:hypothetical protein